MAAIKNQKVQYVNHPNGEPQYAIVPIELWRQMILPEQNEMKFPSEVVAWMQAGDSAMRAWRRYRGLTVLQVAKIVHKSPSYINQLENGVRGADGTRGFSKIETMRAVATALDIKPEWVMPAHWIQQEESA